MLKTNKVNTILLYISLTLIFTQGIFERLTGFTDLPKILVETFVLIFILSGSRLLFHKSNAGYIIIILLFYLLIIGFYHRTLITSFLFFRYTLYAYFIYRIIWNKHFTLIQFEELGKVVLLLIILQGIGSFIQAFIFNDRVEAYVGIMSTSGGALATTFSTLILSILTIYFVFLKKISFKSFLLFLILVVTCFLIAYSSGKRAIYYVIPLFSVFILFFSFKNYNKSNLVHFNNRLIVLIICFMLTIPIAIYGMSNSIGLERYISRKESAINTFKLAYNFAISIENNGLYDGTSQGRFSSTVNILKKSISDPELLLVGDRYGTSRNEFDLKQKYNVSYGITGFTECIINTGIFFSIIVILFWILLIYKFPKLLEKSKIWETVRTIIFLFFVFVHFFYSYDFITHLRLTIFFILIVCLINSPHYFHIRQSIGKKIY